MPEKNRFPAVLQPKSHWEGGEVHPTLNQSAKGSGGVGSSNQELFSQGGAYLVPGQPKYPCPDNDSVGTLCARDFKGVGNQFVQEGKCIPCSTQPVPFRKAKRAQSTTDNETWVVADASNTLNNFDLGDTRTTHAVVGAVYENHAQDSRITGPLDVAPTVAAKFGTGGGNVPLVNQEQIYENSRRDAIRIYKGTSPTLQSFMGTGGCNVPMVQPAMAVRRLTPVECERLQGFPDNWSQIPWKGKPAEECPDGPRYKCAGNSMAVPVMRWIGEQIARVEAEGK